MIFVGFGLFVRLTGPSFRIGGVRAFGKVGNFL